MLLLGYSILYKEYNLTGFNHQKTLLKWSLGRALWQVLSGEVEIEGGAWPTPTRFQGFRDSGFRVHSLRVGSKY